MLQSERLQDHELQDSLPSTGLRDRKGVCMLSARLCPRKRSLSEQASVASQALRSMAWMNRWGGWAGEWAPPHGGCLPGCKRSSWQRASDSPPSVGLYPVQQALFTAPGHVCEQWLLRIIWGAKSKCLSHSHASGFWSLFHFGLSLALYPPVKPYRVPQGKISLATKFTSEKLSRQQKRQLIWYSKQRRVPKVKSLELVPFA